MVNIRKPTAKKPYIVNSKDQDTSVSVDQDFALSPGVGNPGFWLLPELAAPAAIRADRHIVQHLASPLASPATSSSSGAQVAALATSTSTQEDFDTTASSTEHAAVAGQVSRMRSDALYRSDTGIGRNYIPGDNLFGNQWNLRNTGQFGGTPGMDIDVTGAWDRYSGQGVHVGIYDSGVQYTHHDLNGNYDFSRAPIIDGSPHDPYPDTTSPGDAHGTNVAGLIAAENDGTGTVGVAFGASITGISIFTLSDPQFLQAWAQQNVFDVTNNSWGFTAAFADNALNTGDPFFGPFFADIANAASSGRSGLGTVIVHAAGNDRTNEFNSGEARDANDDNFTNSRYVISVAATDNNGYITHYSTPGAAVLVSAPGGGVDTPGIWSTDYLGADGFNSGSVDGYTLDDSTPDYDGVMDGTSAASPQVAGVVALLLQANPNLGWRDVQDILAYSARHVGSAVGTAHTGWELYDWGFNGATTWNGGGLHFDNDYGFGEVDATAAVRLAETWSRQSTSGNENVAGAYVPWAQPVPDNDPAGVSFSISASGFSTYHLEHVEVRLTWSSPHTFLGDLVITLTSPDGTVSKLLDREGTAFGSSFFGLAQALPSDWVYSSNAFRGELANGTWTINVSDNAGGDTGTLSNVGLTFYSGSTGGNDIYVYTNEYATYAGLFGHGTTLTDTNGGIDTINAAAVTSNSTIDLNQGATGNVAGNALTIAVGTVITNAYGGIGNDSLTGNGSANLLGGGGGNDVLDGRAGADTMTGGTGDDTFYVDNAGDIVVEKPAEGNDTVYTSVTYALTAGNAINTLTALGAAAINLTGNAFVNALNGNGAANVISDGGVGGADTMSGLGGNDTYIVNNAGDIVNEAAGAGTDRVATSVSYTLGAGQSIEALTPTSYASTTSINLTGNALAQSITGNAGNNTISDGGVGGADTMSGLGGNDTYLVNNTSDVVNEAAGAGTDHVATTVSYTLTAAQSIEALTPISFGTTTNINFIGNTLAQSITGNAGNNTVGDGGAGAADTMSGLGGNDIYLVNNTGDGVSEAAGAGSDRVATNVSYTLGAGQSVEFLAPVAYGTTTNIAFNGNALAQSIIGNAGNNTLDGKGGQDTLTGGGGNDFFLFDTTPNTTTNDPTVTDFSIGADLIELSHAIYSAISIGALSSSAFFIGSAAHDATDRVIYNSGTGALLYDSDGNGLGGSVQFAKLSAGLTTLSQSQFQVTT